MTKTQPVAVNDRLMIVRLRCSQWSARKYDKKASDTTAQTYGAADAKKVGRFNKMLLERKDLAELTAAFSDLKSTHNAYTAPWTDDGVRVLPSKLYFEYCEKIREHIAEIEMLRDQFIDAYPQLVKDAKANLPGDLYNPMDYPHVDEMKERFAVKYRFEPLPDVEDIRLGLNKEETAAIAADLKASIDEQLKESHRTIVREVISEAQDFVEKMRKYSEQEAEAATKGGKKPRLYDSTIEGLRGLVALVMDGLNIADDPMLTKMAKGIGDAIENIETKDLKADPTLRESKAAAIEKTLNKFQGVFQ